MTVQRIIVRRYGPTALDTVPLIQRAAVDVTRAVVSGNRILVLTVAARSFVGRPLRLATELTTRPPARERAHVVGAADQITAALLAMAVHTQGVPAVSLTWEQAGLTAQSVTEGARSGQLGCERIRVAIERHPAVVLASACDATGNGDTCTIDDAVIRLAVIALRRALGARDFDESLEPSALPTGVTDTRRHIPIRIG
jgi:aspartate kinase